MSAASCEAAINHLLDKKLFDAFLELGGVIQEVGPALSLHLEGTHLVRILPFHRVLPRIAVVLRLPCNSKSGLAGIPSLNDLQTCEEN